MRISPQDAAMRVKSVAPQARVLESAAPQVIHHAADAVVHMGDHSVGLGHGGAEAFFVHLVDTLQLLTPVAQTFDPFAGVGKGFRAFKGGRVIPVAVGLGRGRETSWTLA